MSDFAENAGAMLLHYISDHQRKVSNFADGKILSKDDPRFDLCLSHEFDKLRMLIALAEDAGYTAPLSAEHKNNGLRIYAVCPDCGFEKWMREADGFRCCKCGSFVEPEEMPLYPADELGATSLAASPSMPGQWISTQSEMPEDHPGINMYDDGRMQLITVLADSEGSGLHLRNRLNIRKCGNSFLDSQATDGWVWSGYGAKKDPSYWMPIPRSLV